MSLFRCGGGGAITSFFDFLLSYLYTGGSWQRKAILIDVEGNRTESISGSSWTLTANDVTIQKSSGSDNLVITAPKAYKIYNINDNTLLGTLTANTPTTINSVGSGAVYYFSLD